MIGPWVRVSALALSIVAGAQPAAAQAPWTDQAPCTAPLLPAPYLAAPVLGGPGGRTVLLQWSVSVPALRYTVTVYDAMGRLVGVLFTPAPSITVVAPRGTYLVTVAAEGGRASAPVLVRIP